MGSDDIPGAFAGTPGGPALTYPCTETPTFSDVVTSPGTDIVVGRTVEIGTRFAVFPSEDIGWAASRLEAKADCQFAHSDTALEKVFEVNHSVALPGDKLNEWTTRWSVVMPDGRSLLGQTIYIQKGRLVTAIECLFTVNSGPEDVTVCKSALDLVTQRMIDLLMAR